MTQATVAERGLEGVVAATSGISSIIGATLTYRGIDINELAEHSSFEETVYLLWHGELPSRTELDAFNRELRENRDLPPELLQDLGQYPRSANTMNALRTAISQLAFYDPQAGDMSAEANRAKAIRLVAMFPTVVAAIHRLHEGEDPLAPDPNLSHAANFLYMLTGERPSPLRSRTMDVVLILHADHELNASTFAARVAASTLSDLHSSVVAAICTLKGSLHGGANEAVMRTLEAVGPAENARSYVRDALARKERIMGFCHRVYKEGDPRARWLKKMSRQLAEEAGNPLWFEISALMEEEVRADTGLLPNVDFYSASVYTYLGIPRDLFTPIFAMSRVAGWIAHILEQYADNRLIRPRAEYVGPAARAYLRMENR